MFALDHAVILVRDLGQAAPRYRRLGFSLTPRGAHPSLGTANHTIMLERDYLELLAVVTRGPANERWATALDHGEGLGAMALATRDARSSRAALAPRGLELPEVLDFERPVLIPEGTVAARFSVAQLPPEASPALPAFLCQHHTPEYVWRPEWLHHPNGAFGVAGLTVAHRDPERVAVQYERLLGRASVHPHPSGLTLALGETRLWLVTDRYARARLGAPVPLGDGGSRPVGLTVWVRQLEQARAVLTGNDVPFADFGRRSILVPPTAAHGVALELLAA